MFEYRVTKYDPAFRNAQGAYSGDDWTSISDIGKTFAGEILTRDEYQRVEDAYITVALAFIREAGIPMLTVTGLENHAGVTLDFVEACCSRSHAPRGNARVRRSASRFVEPTTLLVPSRSEIERDAERPGRAFPRRAWERERLG